MGRCKERIPIILEHIDWYDFILKSGYIDALYKPKDTGYLPNINFPPRYIESIILKIVKKCKINVNQIYAFWLDNPDLRLIQVLISMDIIENVPGIWFYCEETEYMITSHILKPELFWVSYGKDGDQELKHILLKDMETDHIEACLRTQKNMHQYYRKTMEKIMRIRKLQKLSK